MMVEIITAFADCRLSCPPFIYNHEQDMKYTQAGNCPYCDAERGIHTPWAMHPYGMALLKTQHDAGHPSNTTPTSAEGPQCTHNVQEAKWVCRDCGKVADDMQEHAHKALVAHAKEEGYDRAKSEAGHTYSRDRYDNDIKEAFEEGRATAQRETVEKIVERFKKVKNMDEATEAYMWLKSLSEQPPKEV